MKRTSLKIILFSVFLLSCLTAAAQSLPFKGGEELRYVVHYKWGVNADLAELNLKCEDDTYNGIPCLHAVGYVSTYKFWDSFYKVRDIYECRFTNDAAMLPLEYGRDVKESKYWAKNHMVWRDPLNSTKVSSIKVNITKSTKPPVDTVYDEGVFIRDMINVIYYMRTQDLSAIGTSKVVTVVADRDMLNLKMRIIGEETVNLKNVGKVRAVKVGVAITPKKQFDYHKHSGIQLDVQESDGTFFGGEKVFIWYSTDASRTPVLFSAPLKVGSINGRLDSYKNTIRPLKLEK